MCLGESQQKLFILFLKFFLIVNESVEKEKALQDL